MAVAKVGDSPAWYGQVRGLQGRGEGRGRGGGAYITSAALLQPASTIRWILVAALLLPAQAACAINSGAQQAIYEPPWLCLCTQTLYMQRYQLTGNSATFNYIRFERLLYRNLHERSSHWKQLQVVCCLLN